MPRKTSRQAPLRAAIESAKRNALIEHIVMHPDLTLADLLGLGDDLGKLARSLTVRELTGGSAAPGRTRSTRGGAGPRTATSAGTVNTKTPAGRAAYDSAILEALRAKRGEMSAAKLRAQCGGTSLQARTALNRLIEAGKVSYEGKARGTRYKAK